MKGRNRGGAGVLLYICFYPSGGIGSLGRCCRCGRRMKSSVQAHRLGRGNKAAEPRAGTTRRFVRVHENLQSQILQVIALGTTRIPRLPHEAERRRYGTQRQAGDGVAETAVAPGTAEQDITMSSRQELDRKTVGPELDGQYSQSSRSRDQARRQGAIRPLDDCFLS